MIVVLKNPHHIIFYTSLQTSLVFLTFVKHFNIFFEIQISCICNITDRQRLRQTKWHPSLYLSSFSLFPTFYCPSFLPLHIISMTCRFFILYPQTSLFRMTLFSYCYVGNLKSDYFSALWNKLDKETMRIR